MAGENLFSTYFYALTGYGPMSWHTRLFSEWIEKDEWPEVVDIPTGLGKTMIMVIWLIARALGLNVPTRLVYVVDRRTVVDQATDFAEEFAFLLAPDDMTGFNKVAERKPELAEHKKKHAAALAQLRDGLGGAGLAISTLRGQLADNREWSRDPSRPAIIIGTVDLIGSALLFSGYRSSYKRRPLEAGLLGQDSLLVLDEAHLSKPFEKLLNAIGKFQRDHGNPLKVIRMSATSGDTAENGVFRLDTDPNSKTFDLWSKLDEKGEEKNAIKTRFEAKKRLAITPLGEKEKLADRLAKEAIKLAVDNSLRGKRIAVFIRKPDDAKTVAKAIREHVIESVDESSPKPKKVKNTPYADAVEVLTGTMRGLERDEFVEKPILKRFLDGNENSGLESNKKPVFLVSTSAGEVGFDLNADHLVGDEAPLDSWIQRLGRVNRRGKGEAIVILIKRKEPTDKNDFDKACTATSNLLVDGMDVSPKTLAAFKQLLTSEQIDQASSPEPTMVELTDILLDAWSMTSITKPMPGRPEVGPWLRGIADELPQTTIAWRAELEHVTDHSDPPKVLQKIFAKHPIRTHESITANSYHVIEFLKQVSKLKDRPNRLLNTRVALRLSRGNIVLRTIEELIKDSGILSAEPTLIFPATFGGLDAAGMLDAESIPKSQKDDDPGPPSLDVADHPGYEQREDAEPRLRVLIRRNESGQWAAHPMPGGVTIPDKLQLEPVYGRSSDLINSLTSDGLRLRLVQPIKFDDEGDPIESIVLLSPVWWKDRPEDQSLSDHVDAVETEARRISAMLNLAESDPIRIALLFAAKWHDEGKMADIWQTYANGPMPDGKPKGKSRKYRDPKSLRRTRHELESLLRIVHPVKCCTSNCVLPVDPVTHDLALHFIAVHHGFGRPHFPTAVYRHFSDSERDAIHTESIRRFARLQRKYGWWRLAWLENLLRCADAIASADQDAEDDLTDVEGGMA